MSLADKSLSVALLLSYKGCLLNQLKSDTVRNLSVLLIWVFLQAGQVPIADLPKHIEEVMIKFYQKKHVQNMADFLLHLVKVFLNEIPSESGISKNPKKAKVCLSSSFPHCIVLLSKSTPGATALFLNLARRSFTVSFSWGTNFRTFKFGRCMYAVSKPDMQMRVD